ncbi:UDP-3-O-(3-hydroxymyristoyl)glucosamine N-acyltransferase [Catenovulum sp. SM1970]|uniref:UDP-3-O-(3-hydroxymyristoyl)glucosamine N-acyltransferase n=1 Tax=Marinifaba aquimaris TaxID=2741323 RepID=UPI0015748782|nr:UDP-3-O-(3-hydroxymyristoyl)glucosamine N-acyltransferase [Marinifaba aquimaris]NTS77083.1 UDP-3-O-(3-hydroxymyristoyl)glucosamine N-acyltransferase [Marinifaba aquimaris]
MKSITLAELAEHTGSELIGEADLQIDSVASITDATVNQATFLTDKKYLSQLGDTQAGVVILHPNHKDDFAGNRLLSNNPYLAYALTAQYLDPTPDVAIEQADVTNIHPTAKVASSAKLAPFCTIEAGAEVGENCQIASGAYIGHGVKLGDNCRVYANACLYFGTKVGSNAIIHANAVIGSDGFGFANDKGKWVKIPQVGNVVLGDNVEVGSNTSIDRGTIKDTIIHDGVKIDNLVHIAHNVVIDTDTALAAGVIMAGSTKIGKRCTMAGGVALNGHINIADDVHVTGFSMVTKSLNEAGVYSSGMPATDNKSWRKNTVKLRQVDSLFDRVKSLEKALAELQAKD